MPFILDLPEIDFLHALALNVLCRILIDNTIGQILWSIKNKKENTEKSTAEDDSNRKDQE